MTNPTTQASPALRFFWNGIKVGTGKLQGARFSDGTLTNHPAGTITIYHKEHCGRFSREIAEAFTVENDTDSQTDYFESDRIRVSPDHPLYSLVREALAKRHYARKYGKAA